MPPFTQYIADEAHYKEVLACMGAVKRELWVGTADIKDVYIRQGRGEAAPLLGGVGGVVGARGECAAHSRQRTRPRLSGRF